MAKSYGQMTGFSKRAILNKQHSIAFSFPDSCAYMYIYIERERYIKIYINLYIYRCMQAAGQQEMFT